MIHQKSILEKLLWIKEEVYHQKPLIHCLTNAISINDCANVVLGLGGKPIMAEHPREVGEITSLANALAVNLGNLTDSRIEAMYISAKMAHECHIPWVIDLVGVGCSSLRRNLANDLITQYKPSVIKGNMSEIRAISCQPSHAIGIDVGGLDQVTSANLDEHIQVLKNLSKQTQATIVSTGSIDLISHLEESYVITNGSPMLARLTGTGCMINVMIATFLSTGMKLEACLLAVLMMGIAGELAQNEKGNGSFRVRLLDEIYSMTAEHFKSYMKLSEYQMVQEEKR